MFSFKVYPKNAEEPLYLNEKDYETFFKVRYLPHLEFENWSVERLARKNCRRGYKRGKIGELAKWLGKLHEREIIDATIPAVDIRYVSDTIGWGLFSSKPLKRWEFVGEYTGVVKRRPLFFANLSDYCFAYPREWITFKPITIDSEKEGNYTRFINHSDYPNLESVGVFFDGLFHVIFRAIKEIPANTELTYDYGDAYWRKREKLPEQAPELT